MDDKRGYVLVENQGHLAYIVGTLDYIYGARVCGVIG